MNSPGTPAPVGIYSVKMPVTKEASVLGYFKFKSKLAWGLATRDWCNLSNMTGMYFGLEYGPANTICWASLRGGGTGSLVIGGPLPAFNAVRPSQQEFSAFNWLAQPNNTILEMWIVFSHTGYPTPFAPPNTPILEVWTKRDGVDVLPVCHTFAVPTPVTLLGQFPASQAIFSNFRPGPSDTATLYFGNVGTADSLEMLDWALFPDYRVVAEEGVAVGSNKVTTHSDGPTMYDCRNGRPQDISPGRWFPMPDAGFLPPSAELYYSPTKVDPSFVVLSKTLPTGSGFQKQEPRLEDVAGDGAVIEAFMSAERIDSANDSVGVGLAIDDGVSLYRAVLLETATRRTIGITKSGTVGAFASYFTPPVGMDQYLDWRSLKLVKLAVDRVRGRVSLFVDGVRYIDESLASMPASVSPVGGRVTFGQLESSVAKSKHNVALLNYLTRYLAWEPDEQLLPDDLLSPVVFTLNVSGAAFQSLNPVVPPATELIIGKAAFDTLNSKCYYSKTLPTFDERHGIQVDFKVKVTGYTDRLGTTFAKSVWVGSGIQVFLGNKKLHLGFFDCGANGRFIGIIPGSGDVDDIINQTALGKKFSYPIDWTSSNFFRLSYRPYDSIDVWINNVPTGPLISIPWLNNTDGFDLPQDVTVATAAFGHFDKDASSTTVWEYFRYGVGNGYEVAVEPLFPDGLKGYLFGGRTLLQTEFDE